MLDHLYRDTAIELVTQDGKVLHGIALPKAKDTAKGVDPVILLDVGARTAAAAAALGVAIGDAATVPKELNELASTASPVAATTTASATPRCCWRWTNSARRSRPA